ncbi:MAG: methyl-accepting chemotaxis sensory transducer, partial [Tardiphaga sp.]|nr:methyl-accepting chemotaxis sensory transducer [Tardiphaga sp.]
MHALQSISARMIVAITLVTAGSCVVLAGFSMWQQQGIVDTALQRELRNDYANITAAMSAETRTNLAVADVLAAMPQIKDVMRAKDRAAALALLNLPYQKILPRGLELITLVVPPGTAFARIHNPGTFDDDMTVRRKMLAQAITTRKALGGVEAGRDVLNVFGSSPVLDGDTLLGAVDVGAPFGKTFVETMKARFNVDIAIHQLNGDTARTLASTLSAATPDTAVIRRALAGETVMQFGELNGKASATAFGQIKTFSGEPVAVFE